MRIRAAAALLGLLGVCFATAAQQDRYRVAGTVLMPQGRSVALVVRPGGDTVSVAAGDDLDGGRVVEIGERFVRVSFPGQDLLLPLSGGPAEVVATASAAGRAPQPTPTVTDAASRDLYMRRMPSKQLLFAVDALAAGLEREVEPSGSDEETGRKLTSLLDGVIGFPRGSVIRDINGQRFSSVAEALEMVEKLVEQPVAVRFGLEGAPEPRPLYVFPE
jgi:hypothetical protein